jgi:hypothetical protein
MSSTHHERPSGVAERLQVSENPVRACSPQTRHVLSQYPSGSQLRHQPGKLSPETRALAQLDSELLPGDADVLTGEPSADEVDSLESAAKLADIPKSNDIWPVSLEHSHAKRVRLALPPALPPRPIEPQIEPADSGEE